MGQPPFQIESNPFATKFVSPGAIAWQANRGPEIVSLRDRFLDRLNRRGALVGPHGSGKSTLLEHLVPYLGRLRFRRDASGQVTTQSDSGNVVWLGLRRHGGAMDLHRDQWQAGGLVVLDGFEQLHGMSRLRVVLETRLKRIGLLVTSHHSTLLPTLMATNVTLPLVGALVAARLAEANDLPPLLAKMLLDERLLGQLLLETEGNVREVFMRLYDRYENWSAESAGLLRDAGLLRPVAELPRIARKPPAW